MSIGVYVSVYICTCIGVYMSVYMCVHECVHKYVYRCVHECVHKYVYRCVHECVHKYVHRCVHECVHKYIHNEANGMATRSPTLVCVRVCVCTPAAERGQYATLRCEEVGCVLLRRPLSANHVA